MPENKDSTLVFGGGFTAIGCLIRSYLLCVRLENTPLLYAFEDTSEGTHAKDMIVASEWEQ
jgi:hypothetical protein